MTSPINTELPPILTFPVETLELISVHARKNVRALRTTCRTFRDCSQRVFNAYTQQLFAQRYGARAACEENTPLYVLVRRIRSSEALAAEMRLNLKALALIDDLVPFGKPRRNDLWLELDTEDVPRLIDYKKRFFESATSPIDLEAKKRFCLSSFNRNTQLQNLIYLQCRVSFELVFRPFHPKQPLHDFRNRCLRLHWLAIERTSLGCALEASEACFNTFLVTLNKTEQGICRSLVPQPSRVLPLENRCALFNTRGVTLCKATIPFWDMENSVEIVASYQFSNDVIKAAKLNFFVRPHHRTAILGSFTVEKTWCNARKYSVLYIDSFEDIIKQDIGNNKWPVALLLIQLAVELFNREQTKELEIVAPHIYANVFDKAGFIEIDRKETFSTFSIEKSSSNPLTRFIYRDGYDVEHSALAAPGLTWEEQMKKSPLLSLPEGPILPPLLFL